MANFAFLPVMPYSEAVYRRGTKSLKEKATQTFLKGALLVNDANGFTGECGAAPAVVGYVAAEDAHNYASDGLGEVLAYQIEPEDLYLFTLLEALAQNLLNVAAGQVGVIRDATTKYWYGSTADANDQITIVDYPKIPGEGVIGDTRARVIAKFRASKIQIV